jgi:Fe-S oxidoreductase
MKMALIDYEMTTTKCSRCSYCKWVPPEMVKNIDFMTICPSIERYNFHSFSSSGKLNIALGLLKERLQYSDALLDIIYKCQMDGACDVSCKNNTDLEPLQAIQELRINCVENGQIIPAHMIVIDGLRKEDNMMQELKADRGKWAEGLDVKDLTKEKADVLYHAGCRYSYDKELQPVARAGLTLLKNAGVDIGIMKGEETCCGGRAYQLGYAAELTKYAEHNTEAIKNAGVKTLVTPCADCYQAFKVLYDKIGMKPKIEILHITEYLERLIKEGKIKLTKAIPMKVTYHDPCHLGRLAEPWIHWEGIEKKVLGQMIVHDPPRKYRRGAKGIYETPRNILRSIAGLEFKEMYRIKEYAWCCGAGGGVISAYPDFAIWTAQKRLEEAESIGAEALVTACPWCKRNFQDTVNESGKKIKILDIIELVQQAMATNEKGVSI